MTTPGRRPIPQRRPTGLASAYRVPASPSASLDPRSLEISYSPLAGTKPGPNGASAGRFVGGGRGAVGNEGGRDGLIETVAREKTDKGVLLRAFCSSLPGIIKAALQALPAVETPLQERNRLFSGTVPKPAGLGVTVHGSVVKLLSKAINSMNSESAASDVAIGTEGPQVSSIPRFAEMLGDYGTEKEIETLAAAVKV